MLKLKSKSYIRFKAKYDADIIPIEFFDDTKQLDGINISGIMQTIGLGDEYDMPCYFDFNYRELFKDCTKWSFNGLKFKKDIPRYVTYSYMFANCKGLTQIPEGFQVIKNYYTFPESNNPDGQISSYYYMFYGCTGLTQIPEDTLLATELGFQCYLGMFYGCTGLTQISENLLHATVLHDSCYANMFANCKGLTQIPENFLKNAKRIGKYSCSDMFQGCTGLRSVKIISEAELGKGCFEQMFYNCENINKIQYACKNLGPDFTLSWVYGVSTQGTWINLNGYNYSNYSDSEIPEGWTIYD